MTGSVLVKFENVGRSLACWQAVLRGWDEAAIIREVKRAGVLLSRGVDVALDGFEGVLLVGGFRIVGRVSVVPDVQPEALERECCGR